MRAAASPRVEVSVVFIKPRRVGELGADRGEFLLFLFCRLVAGQGPAVGVQQVRLVEFPDLEAQGVLDGVALLLTEAVGPDVAAVYEGRTCTPDASGPPNRGP